MRSRRSVKAPNDGWCAKFDSPETGQGLIQGIRLVAYPEERITILPRGLDPEATYIVENSETGETQEIGGSTLVHDGFTFALPSRSRAIWFDTKSSSARLQP